MQEDRRPIVYNLAGIKESIHCSKRVGQGLPGVVVRPSLYLCEVKDELKAAGL